MSRSQEITYFCLLIKEQSERLQEWIRRDHILGDVGVPASQGTVREIIRVDQKRLHTFCACKSRNSQRDWHTRVDQKRSHTCAYPSRNSQREITNKIWVDWDSEEITYLFLPVKEQSERSSIAMWVNQKRSHTLYCVSQGIVVSQRLSIAVWVDCRIWLAEKRTHTCFSCKPRNSQSWDHQ